MNNEVQVVAAFRGQKHFEKKPKAVNVESMEEVQSGEWRTDAFCRNALQWNDKSPAHKRNQK